MPLSIVHKCIVAAGVPGRMGVHWSSRCCTVLGFKQSHTGVSLRPVMCRASGISQCSMGYQVSFTCSREYHAYGSKIVLHLWRATCLAVREKIMHKCREAQLIRALLPLRCRLQVHWCHGLEVSCWSCMCFSIYLCRALLLCECVSPDLA
jgi:hypothetical protein